MAELAIPVLALAGMYVISNQNKKECFSDLEPNNIQNNVQNNTQNNIQNNTQNKLQTKQPLKNYNIKITNEIVNEKDDKILCLSGKKIDPKDFKHSNMQPFFGGKIRGSTNDGLVESRLDNMQGAGSLTIEKTEQAPLFQPHNNLHNVNGAPNMTDFYQSRVNPSLKNSNVVPWKKESVAPGLNQGFTTTAGSGFNTALDARDLWQPKNVDQLRVDTNPKQTFSLAGHQGPLASSIQEITTTKQQGKVEKYGPDTHYTVGPQRWFTSTGIEKAQTAHSIEMLNDQNRIDTTREYYGVQQNENKATYVKGQYEKSRRSVLAPTAVPSGSAVGTSEPREGDYGSKSYNLLPNARTTTEQPESVGGIFGMAKAAMLPLMDILRPSKKENVVGNIRLSGNVQSEVNSLPIYNPGDRTKTTIRETTNEKQHYFIGNQDSNAYLVNKQQSINNNRMNTSIDYTGNACNGNAPTTYDAAYRQRNNVNKNSIERINTGCNQIFNQTENICIAKTDSDRNNNRMWTPSNNYSSIPDARTHGKMNAPQYYDNKMNNERINPDILTAFKKNPYTQSLNSV